MKTSEEIDLISPIPYMKTYFALPLGNREILFCKDEEKCRKYAFELLKGTFESTTNEIVEIDPWLRFCMKEVLEAVAATETKVKTLQARIESESDADRVLKALHDFSKNMPLQREAFTLILLASKYNEGEALLEKIIAPFKSPGKESLQNKSIIEADYFVRQIETKETHFGPHYTVLKFMRLEDFFAQQLRHYNGNTKIDESYDALPTPTLFNCMNDKKCKIVYFEVLRDMTKEEGIKGITSMLADQKDGRTSFTVRFASEKIADEKTVKEIADAVSKLNDPKNERFIVPMYKDNLFLFVDKEGWARKEQIAKNDTFEYKGELKGNKLTELLF